jgi:uncharacterized membrane protein
VKNLKNKLFRLPLLFPQVSLITYSAFLAYAITGFDEVELGVMTVIAGTISIFLLFYFPSLFSVMKKKIETLGVERKIANKRLLFPLFVATYVVMLVIWVQIGFVHFSLSGDQRDTILLSGFAFFVAVPPSCGVLFGKIAGEYFLKQIKEESPSKKEQGGGLEFVL